MSRTVDVYFSVISPWTHLGHAPFLDLAERQGIDVRWTPLPLGPLFAETGGLPLAKRPIQRRHYRDVELLRWADRRGRPLKVRPKHWPFDPALGDRCVIALTEGGEDPAAFAGAVMQGVWEQDRDLADRAVIAELLSAAGHDAEAVIAKAESDAVGDIYAANRIKGQEIGVFGSPTYVLDGETFWGQDRLDLLDEALSSGRPPFRSPDA